MLENHHVVEIPITSLKSPSWKLRPLNKEKVAELARSIQNCGLLQPIMVRKAGGSSYQVIFGNHRLEACRILGKKSIPVIVDERFDDEEMFLARLSENLLRNESVDPIEEAEGYRMLISKGWSIDAIGRRLGKSDSYVCERIGLLKRLDERLHSKIHSPGTHITASHAELLSKIRDPEKQLAIAELVERKRLSVRGLEDILNGLPAPTRVRLDGNGDEITLHIPKEFSEALGFYRNQSVHLYVRGRKLVIESLSPKETVLVARNQETCPIPSSKFTRVNRDSQIRF